MSTFDSADLTQYISSKAVSYTNTPLFLQGDFSELHRPAWISRWWINLNFGNAQGKNAQHRGMLPISERVSLKIREAAFFCLNRLGVANPMDRKQWFQSRGLSQGIAKGKYPQTTSMHHLLVFINCKINLQGDSATTIP